MEVLILNESDVFKGIAVRNKILTIANTGRLNTNIKFSILWAFNAVMKRVAVHALFTYMW